MQIVFCRSVTWLHKGHMIIFSILGHTRLHKSHVITAPHTTLYLYISLILNYKYPKYSKYSFLMGCAHMKNHGFSGVVKCIMDDDEASFQAFG